MKVKTALLVLIAVLVSVIVTADCFAASPKINHKAPKTDELPTPGDLFQITAFIPGQTDPDLDMRIFVISDGKLMDIPMTSGYNLKDEIEYTVELRAPLAELRYHFVFYGQNGDTLLSKRYQLRRKCVPDLTLTKIEIDPGLQGVPKMRALIETADGLEGDIAAYQNVRELLKQIREIDEEAK